MTHQQSNQQQYPQNYPPYEDEINLIDYLKVLWKWKWSIIAGTLVCAVIAAVISLRMPKIYEIFTVIEPGIIGVDNSGNYTYMNSNNIGGKINEGAYNNSIKKLLNINLLKTNLEFKADVGRFTNQIKISTKCKEKEIDLGLKASKQLFALISDDNEKIIKQRKDDYDKQIAVAKDQISKIEIQERKDIDKQILAKQNEISKVKKQWERDNDKKVELKLNVIKDKRDQIKLQQAMLKIIGQRVAELTLQIKGVKGNTDYLIPLSKQIYDLKTNIAIKEANIENLKDDVDLISTEIEDLKLQRTEELQAKINKIKTQISTLISEKENISNIKLIQNPEVSSAPVKSKKKQIVILSVVVGLFFMIFLAFFIEYIKNATAFAKQQ